MNNNKISSYHPPTRFLMGAGPSQVYPRVLNAIGQPTIGHLDPQFVQLMEETQSLLQYAFQTKNPVTMVVSGPGSTGMETCFTNLVAPGDEVAVCINGYFGERIKKMVECAGGKAILVEDPWGKTVNPQKLEDTLKKHPNIMAVAFVHAETSTGVQSDAKTLAEIARRHHCLSIMDAVTSIGGTPVYTDEWGIDAIYTGSQKCLSSVPGLSPISFSEAAMERVKKRANSMRSWFLDLNLASAYWIGNGGRPYHHTAPINSLYALHESLVILQEEGLEASWNRHRENYKTMKKELGKMGLHYLPAEEDRLPQLNAVLIPDDINDLEVRKKLLSDYNLEISGGIGPFAQKLWRIGLMGYSSSKFHTLLCTEALRKTLQPQNIYT